LETLDSLTLRTVVVVVVVVSWSERQQTPTIANSNLQNFQSV